MGGYVLAPEIQKILERLMSPISEIERQDIRTQIENLVVPAVISKEDITYYFENIYTYFHTQGISESFEQKQARQMNTREFYRMLGVKLLRGKPKDYAEIPKRIFARKVQERAAATAREANQAVLALLQEEADESAKAWANSVLKGGARKKKRTRRMRR